MPDLDIATAAARPKRTTVDGTTVEEHDLGDLIDAERRTASDTATGTNRRGLILNKLRPPGAV